MDRHWRPGALRAVTGPAGCGKSASVAGRIVSLASPSERAVLIRAQGVPPPGLDPLEGSVAAHLQVRGTTFERCAELLAQALGIPGLSRVANHNDVLTWAQNDDTRPVIVIDGLDETDAAFKIATDLIAPLAMRARVLVASREVPGSGATEPSLLETLGPPAVSVDLEDDPNETAGDVHAYVVSRLTHASGERIHAGDRPGCGGADGGRERADPLEPRALTRARSCSRGS